MDIFLNSGEPLQRIDLASLLSPYSVDICEITHVQVPALNWSSRATTEKLDIHGFAQNDTGRKDSCCSSEAGAQPKSLTKIIVAGECVLEVNDLESHLDCMPSEYTTLPPDSVANAPQTSNFMILINLQERNPKQIINHTKAKWNPRAEQIKILRLPDEELLPFTSITSLSYGPYDNGYLLAGTSSGHLLVYDPLSLKRLGSCQVFGPEEGAITCIIFDPTHLVLLSSSSGAIRATSLIQHTKSYVYIDLGCKDYCTVAVNRRPSLPSKTSFLCC